MRSRVIMHVISGLRIGGAENMLASIIEHSSSFNDEHIVLSLTSGGIVKERIENMGVKVYDIGLQSAFDMPRSLFRIISLIKKYQPNVIQGWMYYGDLFAAICLYASGRRSKTSLYWGVRNSNLNLRKYSFQLRVAIKFCSMLSFLPDKIVSNSSKGVDFHKDLGYQEDKFIIIENGLDSKKFQANKRFRQKIRNDLGIDDERLIVVMSARIDPMKNHELFIDAVSRIPGVTGLVLGRGTEDFNKQNNIFFLGEKQNTNEYLAASDIFVSPSLFGEGLSNSLAEAMASELLVVYTDVGDNKKLVGNCGYVLQTNSSNELCKVIDNLIALSPKERKNIGKKARERIIKHYPIEKTVNKFGELYQSYK